MGMKNVNDMTDEQIEDRITKLAFDGDALRFREFCARLKSGIARGHRRRISRQRRDQQTL